MVSLVLMDLLPEEVLLNSHVFMPCLIWALERNKLLAIDIFDVKMDLCRWYNQIATYCLEIISSMKALNLGQWESLQYYLNAEISWRRWGGLQYYLNMAVTTSEGNLLVWFNPHGWFLHYNVGSHLRSLSLPIYIENYLIRKWLWRHTT